MLLTPEWILNITFLLFLVIIALAAISAKNLITSAVMLIFFSLIMAMEYLVLAAPDVAMTEAAIGAGISTILILTAFVFTGTSIKPPKPSWWLITGAALAVIFTGSTLIYASLGLPHFGDVSAPAHAYLRLDYIKGTIHAIGIPNSVTAILASYRAYDTLGETVVVVGAGLSVYLLLGRPAIKTTPTKDRSDSV
ncbi:MAG: DUF4040 domain-containing protein [Alphaproteobacteria bacterium]|nr:DUF4040 domain-containing protein [Alphaproteobacteria bacterium]